MVALADLLHGMNGILLTPPKRHQAFHHLFRTSIFRGTCFRRSAFDLAKVNGPFKLKDDFLRTFFT